MVKILIQITHGPENPTRAALGFHVAKAAIEEGHEVTMFLAGPGVHLMRKGVIDHMRGLGTANLREVYDVIIANGTKFYLGTSSKTGSLTEAELEGKNYEFATPKQLVQLAIEHYRMFNY